MLNLNDHSDHEIFDAAVERIRKEEGFSKNAYWDNNHYSIGYGTPAIIPEGTKAVDIPAITITLEDAEKEMREYVHDAYDDILSIFAGVPMTRTRFVALVDMRYNLGASGFRGFKHMISAIKTRKWCCAAIEAWDSKWRKQFEELGSERANKVIKNLKEG